MDLPEHRESFLVNAIKYVYTVCRWYSEMPSGQQNVTLLDHRRGVSERKNATDLACSLVTGLWKPLTGKRRWVRINVHDSLLSPLLFDNEDGD